MAATCWSNCPASKAREGCKRVLSLVLATLPLAACVKDQLTVRDDLHYEIVDGGIANMPFTGLVQTRYRNGNPWLEAAYQDGLPDGISQSRYRSGQLWSELTYKPGKRKRPYRRLHANGQLESEARFAGDQ